VNPRSIRFRLATLYAVILTLTLGAVGVGMWWAVRQSIHDTVDSDLRGRLAAMRGFLSKQAAEGEAGKLGEELEEQSALLPAGAYFRIADREGRWIYRSKGTEGWSPQLPQDEPLTERGKAQTVVVNGDPVRVLTAPAPGGVIQIGIPIDEFFDMLEDFGWTMALASPLLLLVASASGYWMSRRALEPVDEIARTAELISAQNLTQRLPLRGTGDELDRLSGTLNGMFERLESSFRRMAQFTADASHELRTPVAIIRTTAELARSRPRAAEEYERVLGLISAESERTSTLIEDLMVLARADAGASQLTMEPVNVAEVLRDVSSDVKVLADSAGVQLQARESVPVFIAGDEHALRRLFLALLDNAIRYTPRGGKVDVSLSVGRSGEKSTATVEVKDTGAGIPANDLPHVFERFYRAAKDRARHTGGTGLGLSIAQWIAAQHGGEIVVESEPGIGSTFRVRLPVQG